MARTTGWDGKPLSEKDKKFFALRDSGYKGPIDQDGDKAKVVGKGNDLRIVKKK
jgi:hypothetical protein